MRCASDRVVHQTGSTLTLGGDGYHLPIVTAFKNTKNRAILVEVERVGQYFCHLIYSECTFFPTIGLSLLKAGLLCSKRFLRSFFATVPA
jgi:hypothetical protein